MNESKQLRLGTRSSLLAVAQSRLVAAELERAHPGLQVDIICMDTRGDRDTTTPLTDVNDPDFFSAELDRALLNNEIDICVHSYKDLSRKRPAGISTGAIPHRADPRDVILFRGDIDKVLESQTSIRIGSSSLRRQINIGDFLPQALPGRQKQPEIEFQPLRGPVHERAQRISAGTEQLDGVVLALAGLSRLWNDPDGRAALEPVLANARWMVLPLSTCPTAVGQGALAIECRATDTPTQLLLEAINHPETASLVQTEITLLNEYAPDDQAGFGTTAIAEAELNSVAWLRGRAELNSKQTISITSTAASLSPATEGTAWDDTAWLKHTKAEPLNISLPTTGAVFVAHWRALADRQAAAQVRYWTSGVRSWLQLAKQGVWVEGCADNLGFESIKSTLQEAVLTLPELQHWTALTHEDAVPSWADSGIKTALASYRSNVDLQRQPDFGQQLAACKYFFWSSARQYESLRDWVPAGAKHACGTGKTLQALRTTGLKDVQAFASRREWQAWLS
jgi:hydroxymethylbilane synthase